MHQLKMDEFLQLPDAEEQEFWRNPNATRILDRFDQFALLYAIFNNTLILRSLSLTGMSWLSSSATVLYVTLALAQMLLMIMAPAQHTKHRLKLALFNRVLRLAISMAFAASTFANPSIMANFTAAVNTQRRINSPLANLLRPVVAPTLVTLGHCNHVLPFVYVLPLQLILVVTITSTRARALACAMSTYPAYNDSAQQVCQLLHKVMYYTSMAVGRPPSEPAASSSQAAADIGVCRDGLASIWQLLLFAHVGMVFVLPCMAIYCVELSMKVRFLRDKGVVMKDVPVMESHMARIVLACSAVVMVWFATAALTDWLSPINCDSKGRLAFLT